MFHLFIKVDSLSPFLHKEPSFTTSKTDETGVLGKSPQLAFSGKVLDGDSTIMTGSRKVPARGGSGSTSKTTQDPISGLGSFVDGPEGTPRTLGG